MELDRPSDDPGDRLHASAHAWPNDTATELTIEVRRSDGELIEVTTLIAEPGPLVAMKLQAIMNRSTHKQGTDLRDIVRLLFDAAARPAALAQIGSVRAGIARDIATHAELWFARERDRSLRWIRAAGGEDVTRDDLDLLAELLLAATRR